MPIGYQSLSDIIRSVSINSGATICAVKQRPLSPEMVRQPCIKHVAVLARPRGNARNSIMTTCACYSGLQFQSLGKPKFWMPKMRLEVAYRSHLNGMII